MDPIYAYDINLWLDKQSYIYKTDSDQFGRDAISLKSESHS